MKFLWGWLLIDTVIDIYREVNDVHMEVKEVYMEVKDGYMEEGVSFMLGSLRENLLPNHPRT